MAAELDGNAFQTEDTRDDRCSGCTQRLQAVGLGSPMGWQGMRIRTAQGLLLTPGTGSRADECGDLYGESRKFFAVKIYDFFAMQATALSGGFNWWVQHTKYCAGRRSVANEVSDKNLLYG